MKLIRRNHQTGSYQRIGQLPVFGLVACLLSLVLVFWLTTPLNRDWEDRFQTNYYMMRSIFGEPKVSSLPLVTILIDDNSLPAGSPRSPIDRQWMTKQVRKIVRQDPALIVLNVLLDRSSNKDVDAQLAQIIKESGNIILRDDPIYPVRTSFAAAALDRGSIRFRFDSAGNLQEVCNNPTTCQSSRILHRQIWKRFSPTINKKKVDVIPPNSWLKINYSSGSSSADSFQLAAYPVIRVQELDNLPEGALKGKLILVGTGFSDIYPRYRIPLGSPPLELQETEILGQLLQMMAANTYLHSIHFAWIGLITFGFMVILAMIMIYRSQISALLAGLLLVVIYFFVCSIGFAFYNLEIPFILPISTVLTYLAGGIFYQSIQDRFSRLKLELTLKEKQIEFLTNELHTHHLFNEFSRISVMMKQHPAAAREYLIEFAEMLRLSLKYGDQRLVPISVQMEFINLYINQQKIIHQNRLTFDQLLDTTSLEQTTAPWHTFFPLVENAVKYAEAYLKTTPDTAPQVRIELNRSAQRLIFIVENPFDSTPIVSTKTGLENLRKRLELAYPKGNFTLESSASDQTWVTRLILPITD